MFNLLWPNWTTNGKEVFLPQRLGDISFVHFYPYSCLGDYIQKRDHTGVLFLDSLKMRTPSSIYFLELAKNPQDCVITVSLGATPYIIVWKHSPIGSPLFRVFCNESSLDPLDIKSPSYLPQVFPICSYSPCTTVMIPLP